MKRSAASPLATPEVGPMPDALASMAPFPYGDYVDAKRTIEEAIRGGFFYCVITGLTGTGKTSIMRDLRQGLDRHRHHIVYLSASKVSLLGLVRYFAQTIHVTPRRSGLETSRLITQAIREQAAHVLVWIDEAHRLAPETLAEISSLAEFDPDAPQVFSVIFSGPLELTSILDDRRLAALRRRITVRCTLAGLRRDELDTFLLHRLGAADDRRLVASLRDELFERSQGVPAVVDSVVRAALRRAGDGEISERILREVLDVQTL